MDVVRYWGLHRAEIASGDLAQESTAHRAFLTERGVVFPSEEAIRVRQQHTAYTDMMNNRVALNADGSVFDPESYDVVTGKDILDKNKGLYVNVERLDSLIDLDLYAKAGAAALQAAIDREDSSEVVAQSQKVLLAYKQFVRLCVATVEWGKPWVDLWTHEFPDARLAIPLSERSLVPALQLVDSQSFKTLRERHFRGIELYRYDMLRAIEADPTCQPLTQESARNASVAATFYRHSPAATNHYVQALINNGRLPQGIVWQRVIEHAANGAAEKFAA